jgi:hypothetical protein
MHGNAVRGPDSDQGSTLDGDETVPFRSAAADVSHVVDLAAMNLAYGRNA